MSKSLISAINFRLKTGEFFRELIEALLERPEAEEDIIHLAITRFREILKADLLVWLSKAEDTIIIKKLIHGKSYSFSELNKLTQELIKQDEIVKVIETGKEYCDFIKIGNYSYRQCFISPIKLGSEVTGALCIFWEIPLPEHHGIIELIAYFSLILIYQERVKELGAKTLFTTTQRQLDERTKSYDALQVMCSKVGAFHDPEEEEEPPANILNYLVHKAFKVELGIIWGKNDKGEWENIVSTGDASIINKLCEAVKSAPKDSFIEKIANSTREDNRRYEEKSLEKVSYPETTIPGLEIHSMTGVPIRIGKDIKNTKVIVLYNKKEKSLFHSKNKPSYFTKSEQRLLEAISNPLSLCFKFNNRLEDELSKRSKT
jgi:hypothetical protein